MPATLVYPLAALAEIAGCFAVWVWWRGASPLWLLPGIASLALFGWLLAQVEAVLGDNHLVRRRQPSWPLPPVGGRA